MDNFSIDITCQGKASLALAIQIVSSFRKIAVAYRIHPEKGMILYWSKPDKGASADIVALPFAHESEAITNLVWGWLNSKECTPIGPEPDHDGSNGRGWHLYNESWGHVDNDWRAFIAVRPAWAQYGK
jgi:hypothetical protein